MVRMYQITRKGMAWHSPIPIYPVLDSSFFKSEFKHEIKVGSDRKFEWAAAKEVVSNEVVDMGVSNITVFEHRDSDSEVQVFEPPLVPVVDLVTESEVDSEEVEILEPPPIPVVVLVSEDEEEIALPLTLP
jgi:hypothetical protein